MNVKNNRLNRETDEKIIRTVYAMMTQQHRPIGKITVREICEGAGVHRSTFYAHYQDVYDLVEKVEQSMSQHNFLYKLLNFFILWFHIIPPHSLNLLFLVLLAL